jgi:hypothetical protein
MNNPTPIAGAKEAARIAIRNDLTSMAATQTLF